MAQASQVAQNAMMEELMKQSPPVFRPKPGELVEGNVVYKGKNKILVDLNGVTTGIISGRELRDSFNTFRELQEGANVAALVLEEQNNEGLVVLSLRMIVRSKKPGSAYALSQLYAKIRHLNALLADLLEASYDVLKRLFVKVFIDKQAIG